jgi:hypothetical protein
MTPSNVYDVKGFSRGFGLLFIIITLTVVSLATSTDEAHAATTFVDGTWTIQEPTAISDGTWFVNGSVSIKNGILNLTNAELIIDGGSLSVDPDSFLNAKDSIIRGNISNLSIDISGEARLVNTNIRNLHLGGLEGVISVNGKVQMDNCTVLFNRGKGFYGYPSLEIRNSTLSNFWRSIYIEYAATSYLLVENSTFEGAYLGSTAIELSSFDNKNDIAIIRGCTFRNCTAIEATGFKRNGRLSVENNTAVNCSGGGKFYAVGKAVTLRNNLWNMTWGPGLYFEVSRDSNPYVEGDVIEGGGTGLEIKGNPWGPSMTMRSLELTGSDTGVRAKNIELNLSECYIRAYKLELMLEGTGYIHLYGCDHTRSGGVVSEEGEIADANLVNITEVTWQEGTPIMEGFLYFVYEGVIISSTRHNANPEPIVLPTWYVTSEVELTIDRLRAAYDINNWTFYSLPFVFEGLDEMVIVVYDDYVPDIEVVHPKDGSLFGKDEVKADGYFTEKGVGIGSVRARVDGGKWQGPGITEQNQWRITIWIPEDGIHTIDVNLTDRAGNSMQVSIANVTTDTTPPPIEILRPARWVRSSPVALAVRTEAGALAFVQKIPVAVDYMGVFEIAIDLREGPNQVTIEVLDRLGHRNYTVYEIELDTDPPVLWIDEPEDGSWTGDRFVSVSGVTEETARLTVNGYEVEVNGTEFSVSFNVDEGTVHFEILAFDRAGNPTSTVVTVHVDHTPPEVEILEPTENLTLSDPDIMVNGYVRDASPVTVTVNGEEAGVGGSGWYLRVHLDEGWNDIVVEARDKVGNYASSTISVLVDTRAPTANVYLLVGGLEVFPWDCPHETGAEAVTLMITVDEPSLVSVSVRGDFHVQDEELKLHISIQEGLNVMKIDITDIVGNEVPTIRFEVVRDAEPPTLTILKPLHGSPSDTKEIRVEGFTESGANLTINGRPVTVAKDGSFSHVVKLPEGQNLIRVVAKDAHGNSVKEEVLVVVKLPGKTLFQQGPYFFLVVLGVAFCVLALMFLRRRALLGGPDSQSREGISQHRKKV